MINVIKNVAGSSFNETEVTEGFFVLKIENYSDENQQFNRNLDNDYIQFHYCLKGGSTFNFNGGRYQFEVPGEQMLLLYNPQTDLPIDLVLQPSSIMISLLITIKKFHSLFSKDADYIHFLNEETKDKKYYDNKRISPSVSVVLNQILHSNMHPSIENLYFQGKCLELLSLHFNRSGDADVEQCPFLVDEQNVLKIRKAKDIITSRIADPPSLQELANETGLNIKKLKEGFKQIYGDTVYGFLFDYKMEYARKLLETNQYNINEVGCKVGYSTASHFIAAFKKKYGTTPKKYIQ
ncbi:MAG: helix-turn-helix transcriptional regulator [Flavobacteriaceae bacterium]|nr:helix-turn-helix transcriptional regulator [Flavobacteriaceae bacterium]MCB0475275.1 helix-turn-helix transcriptional regulator [Flavobacteriaceae bacterium]